MILEVGVNLDKECLEVSKEVCQACLGWVDGGTTCLAPILSLMLQLLSWKLTWDVSAHLASLW